MAYCEVPLSSGLWLLGEATCNLAISQATEVGSPVSISSSLGETVILPPEVNGRVLSMSTSIEGSVSWSLRGLVASTLVRPLSSGSSTMTSLYTVPHWSWIGPGLPDGPLLPVSDSPQGDPHSQQLRLQLY